MMRAQRIVTYSLINNYISLIQCIDDMEDQETNVADNLPILPVISRVTNNKYRPGSILRVKLHNFVTYDDCEFCPGPHLNVILGYVLVQRSLCSHLQAKWNRKKFYCLCICPWICWEYKCMCSTMLTNVDPWTSKRCKLVY